MDQPNDPSVAQYVQRLRQRLHGGVLEMHVLRQVCHWNIVALHNRDRDDYVEWLRIEAPFLLVSETKHSELLPL